MGMRLVFVVSTDAHFLGLPLGLGSQALRDLQVASLAEPILEEVAPPGGE